MVIYKITGDSYGKRAEIKSHARKNKHWKFNSDEKCWVLEIPVSSNTKHFREDIEEMCRRNGWELEIEKEETHGGGEVKMSTFIDKDGKLNGSGYTQALHNFGKRYGRL